MRQVVRPRRAYNLAVLFGVHVKRKEAAADEPQGAFRRSEGKFGKYRANEASASKRLLKKAKARWFSFVYFLRARASASFSVLYRKKRARDMRVSPLC